MVVRALHPGHDLPSGVAGLIIASATGPGRVEAARVTDEATRFGRTVNLMLRQLFGAWQPDAATPASGRSSATPSVPQAAPGHAARPDRHRRPARGLAGGPQESNG